ncbi:MAG: ABC transporter permease [Bacteroidetes bacterium]|jgi:ABC-type transport system involved in multi-copper enzyme maturation permease subunit|nr:ABC transporter permease [Bacteroidota bacterium]
MSGRRLGTIAGHELRVHLTGPLFWALVLFIGLATVSLNPGALIPASGASGEGAQLFINSRYVAAESFALVSFFLYNFFAAIMAGLSVLRDDEDRVTELLHATPLTSGEYVLGKVVGVMGALGLALVLHTGILIWFAQLAPVWNAATVRGPFVLSHFVGPALTFALPGIWFSAGLAFAVGEWTRRPLAVYAVPTVLFLVTVFVFNAAPLRGLPSAVEHALMIADPSGLRWLRQTAFAVDRGIAFYNTAPIPYDAVFLLCRLVVVGLPLLAVAVSVRHYRDTLTGSQRTRRTAPEQPSDARPALSNQRLSFRSLRDLGMTVRAPGFGASVRQVLRAELRELRAQPAAYLFGGLTLLLVVEFATSAEVAGAPVLLTAGILAVGTIEVISFLLCLLLLFYTVESVHRERSTGFEAILYAAPLRTSALLLGKSLAGGVLVGIVLLSCTALGTVLVAMLGEQVELWPFGLVWGGIVGPTLVLWQAFVLMLLALFRGRYAAYAIGLSVLGVSLFAALSGATTWVTNWTVSGALRWSDMGLFTLNGTPLLLNRIVALGLGAVLGVVAIRVFPRTRRDPARTLDRLRPAGLARMALRLAPFAAIPLLAGGYLAVEVNTGFQGAGAAERDRAYRQQHLATWGDVTSPHRTHIDLRVDLHPQARRADIEGRYTLVNTTTVPMQHLPFTVRPSFGPVTWTLGGETAEASYRAGLYVLTPPAPLPPGDTAHVGFAYTGTYPPGFTRNGGGVEQFALPSGVVLHTLRDDFLPVPGFVDTIGRAEAERYAPSAPDLAAWTGILDPVVGEATPFTTRIEVAAPSAYTVNSVGEKTSERTEEGRTTVVWESTEPIRALNIVAGRWDVRRQAEAAVFYHPEHDHNVEEMVATLAAARRWYSEWFYPYPWSELRLNEFPNTVTIAQGFPTNISFSEGLGFLARTEAVPSPVFTVTAHEAAHQWWGNLLTPGDAPGADVLIEGMAHYSTLLLYEAERGLRERMAFARDLEARYLTRRRVDAERPLAAMTDEGRPGDETVVFDKGAWALWMLHHYLGHEQMVAGLQAFIRAYRAPPDGDHPAVQDLIATLRPLGADSAAFQRIVEQWFFDVVLPEYRVSEATVAEAGGRWTVTATVENVGTGSMPVEVAVARGVRFREAARDAATAYIEARRTITLGPGQVQRVTWTVDFPPERIVVDPDVLVLQANRDRAVASL